MGSGLEHALVERLACQRAASTEPWMELCLVCGKDSWMAAWMETSGVAWKGLVAVERLAVAAAELRAEIRVGEMVCASVSRLVSTLEHEKAASMVARTAASKVAATDIELWAASKARMSKATEVDLLAAS